MTRPTRTHAETRIKEVVHHLGYRVGHVLRVDVSDTRGLRRRITATCAECCRELDAQGTPVPDDDHGPRRYLTDPDLAACAIAAHSTRCDEMISEMARTTGTLFQNVTIDGRQVGTVLLNVGALAEGDSTPYSAIYDEPGGKESTCNKFASFDRAQRWVVYRACVDAAAPCDCGGKPEAQANPYLCEIGCNDCCDGATDAPHYRVAYGQTWPEALANWDAMISEYLPESAEASC